MRSKLAPSSFSITDKEIMTRIFNTLCIAAILIMFVTACKQSQEKITADKLSVSWKMGENHYQGKGGFISSFTIVNKSSQTLTSGWNIYFNFPRNVRPETVTNGAAIRHINGDFFELSPKPDFNLASGDSVKIDFVSSDWAMNKSDAPAGLYLVTTEGDKENKPEIIANYTIEPFTDEKQSQRSPDDHAPVVSAAVSYQRYKADKSSDDLQPLIPSPVSFVKGSGNFTLDQTVSVNAAAALQSEKQMLESILKERLQNALVSTSNKTISLSIGTVSYQGKQLAKGSEAYKLEIKNSRITIVGTDAAGVFYGIQTLMALMPVDVFKTKSPQIELNNVTIVDYPRFSYRGIHLDVARNFQKKEEVKKMLDLMAFYKLNKLHFHLSDDEGWRVELKSLPELTAVGGQRGHDKTGRGMVPSFGSGPFPDDKDSNGSGFYTEDDFIEILRYANARHIEVVPKIDMPGHARAAIKAMDARYEKLKNQENNIEATQYLLRDLQDSSQYTSVQMWNDNVICLCQESTYNFIATVVNDFVKLYEKANVPFNTFHIGADEVPHGAWEKSPVCKSFFKSQNTTPDQLPEYFFKRVSEILKSRNLNMGGWEEIALKKTKTADGVSLEANPAFVNANFRPYVWNSVWGWAQEDVGYKLANAGYKTVLGNVTNLYFDLAYEKHPDETGYYWGAFVDTKKVYEFNPFNIYLGVTEDKFGNPLNQEMLNSKVRISETGKKNILGIQGQLWAENLKGDKVLEYMAFPKLIALSERAWAKDPAWSTIKSDPERNTEFQKSWTRFANTVGQKDLPRLDHLFGGVNYRISPPGAEIKEGQLYASTEYSGLVIRYTTDGSEPSASSAVYSSPVPVKNETVKLKTFTSTDRASRTVIIKGQ
jgi:hexosaminidase